MVPEEVLAVVEVLADLDEALVELEEVQKEQLLALLMIRMALLIKLVYIILQAVAKVVIL